MIAERTFADEVAERFRGMLARRLSPTPRPAPAPPAPRHRVIEALTQAGRPLTNAELAQALGVSPSRCTRLRAQVADQLRTERRGRKLMISIA